MAGSSCYGWTFRAEIIVGLFPDAYSYCSLRKYFSYVFVGVYCELHRRCGDDTYPLRHRTFCRKRVCGGSYKQKQKRVKAPRTKVGQRAVHSLFFKGHKHSSLRSGKYVSRFGRLWTMEIYAWFFSWDTSRNNYHYPDGCKC